MILNPCKYCKKRNPTCHATCNEYLDFYKENQDRLKKKDEVREIDLYMNSKRTLHNCTSMIPKKFRTIKQI